MVSTRTRVVVVAAATASLALAAAAGSAGGEREATAARTPETLVRIDPASLQAEAVLRAAGGVEIAPRLAVWRLPSAAARRVRPRLTELGALRSVEPDRRLRPASHISGGDRFLPEQWWLEAIGADRAEPPPGGVPLTILDDGLDFNHPEFEGRRETVALNGQRIDTEDSHGTAVASIAASPADGKGLVGIYPRARLRSWDGGMLSVGELVAGFEAATARGRGVINISLGSSTYSPALAHAVYAAVNAGSLVVAPVGNDRAVGSPALYPGSLPHVLTVGAVDRAGIAAGFSSRSQAVDIAAPGQDILVAVPSFFSARGYLRGDGTSFASPMVASAAAWIWTERPNLHATQVSELLRRTARDVSPAGRDAQTGYGVLDIPAALSGRAPAIDPQEPNDDVELVRPRGVFVAGKTPVLRRGMKIGRISAQLDATEDRRDLYRIWVPAKGRATAVLTGRSDVDLAIWSPQARTVLAGGASRKRTLISASRRSGITVERAGVRNEGPVGAYYYVAVSIGRGIPATNYRLSVLAPRS